MNGGSITIVLRRESSHNWLVSSGLRFVVSRGVVSTLRGVVLFVLALVELVLFTLAVVAGSLVWVGLGVFLLPPTMSAVRRVTNTQRSLASRWSTVDIEVPYLPEQRDMRAWQRCHWLLGDRATWRDTLFLLVDPMIGPLLTLLPAAVIVNAVRGVVMPFDDATWLGSWFMFFPVDGEPMRIVAAVLGVLLVPPALLFAPLLLRAHAMLAKTLLSPTENTRLAHRVQRLTETRNDAVGSQASELRRIERNLHDGAQARIVAMGMTLDAAKRMIEKNPEAAKSLVDEAMSSSAKALRELRDLVRGIQPPVLVDRGIADAIRSMAMESPLRIETAIDLPGRPAPAVETAAYFAVSELLTNAVKHSGAESGEIAVRHERGRLLIFVTDYGSGGADMESGSGLHGVDRRLAALDGFITILSPLGGPTTVAIEIPCELSA